MSEHEPLAPNEYRIATLRDIFNLPTYEQVERALREMTPVILEARAYADLMVETARFLSEQDGNAFPAGRLVEFPESVIWKDDNGGTSEIKFNHGEDTIAEVHLKHAPRAEPTNGTPADHATAGAADPSTKLQPPNLS